MATAHRRCAIYTRKSSEEGLEQSFNSLDAQREACVAYVLSQRHEGWKALDAHYDDGGYSGGSMERPALQVLLKDIVGGRVDVVVVYKVDRLTRSLSDFARIVELFDRHGVSFVSVTQQFNTTTSMGRLTLNVLLSFAQFEREVTGERIRDKIAASKKKGMWMGGAVPLGYDVTDRRLVPNPDEAQFVRHIYTRYLALGCVRRLQLELKARSLFSKKRTSRAGKTTGGMPYSRGALYSILRNRLYRGEIAHRGAIHAGQHEAIVDRTLWDEVQLRLKANNDARRAGTQAKAPSLLAGLVYDREGHRLTPLHSTKSGKRYRYYTSRKLIQHGPNASDAALRIPAYELEQLVLGRLCHFTASAPEVLNAVALGADPASVQQALVGAGKALSATVLTEAGSEARKFLSAAVARIVVAPDSVAIHLNRASLRGFLGARAFGKTVDAYVKAASPDPGALVLQCDVRFRRLSGAVRLIVPPASSADNAVNDALVKALARARQWYTGIASGEVPSLHALSRSTGLNERYVSRILRCALLAPDIVQVIVDGRQPPHLTLDLLLRGIPGSWKEQRERFLRSPA